MVKKKPNGYIIWEGVSQLDGKTPVVLIATGFKNNTQNPKTGNMIQTWIICRDTHPSEAINNGEDKGICGDCPHRKIDGKRSCYVNQMSIASVYRAYKAGKYSSDFSPSLLIDRKLRVGSYGEPTAVPLDIWKELLYYVSSHTGYTHQWLRFPEFAGICMASVDSKAQQVVAESLGWRTFRVTVPQEELSDSEIRCPNEVNSDIQCSRCRLCEGNEHRSARSIAITVHGVGAKHYVQAVVTTGGTESGV